MLTEDERRCLVGDHGPFDEIIWRAAQDCVNVDRICQRCGQRIDTVSWNMAAWEKRHEWRVQRRRA